MAKLKIVLSDLHLGAGQEADGNSLEDFDSDQDLADLLDRIAGESQRDGADVELILNGDTFEMLQVPHVDSFDPAYVYTPEQYHSSSENDSLRKMAIIIDGHPIVFDALERFVSPGSPHRYVTFVKGNHDLNLHWPRVQDRIRRATDTTGDRAFLLVFEERLVSREGIYVEHGNQYAEAIDRIPDMEEPHDHARPGQLTLPLGSWLVMDVFNEVERQKYWIDGVKPITALVWYALAFDFAFAARAIKTLIRRFPSVVHEGLFDVEPRRANALALLLDEPTRVSDLAGRYQADQTFRQEFNAEALRTLAPLIPASGVDLTPRIADVDPIRMGDQTTSRVRSSLFEAARQRAAEEGAKLVTFGHTHDAGIEDLPGGAAYVNSGTWTWRADFTGADEQTWRELFQHPEWFTGERMLNYVRIDYTEDGQPHGRLLVYEPGDLEPVEPPIPTPRAPKGLFAWLCHWWARLMASP